MNILLLVLLLNEGVDELSEVLLLIRDLCLGLKLLHVNHDQRYNGIWCHHHWCGWLNECTECRHLEHTFIN